MIFHMVLYIYVCVFLLFTHCQCRQQGKMEHFESQIRKTAVFFVSVWFWRGNTNVGVPCNMFSILSLWCFSLSPWRKHSPYPWIFLYITVVASWFWRGSEVLEVSSTQKVRCNRTPHQSASFTSRSKLQGDFKVSQTTCSRCAVMWFGLPGGLTAKK